MNRFQLVWQKILALFRIRLMSGGLEINDQFLRFAYFDGKLWQLKSVRLEPGVLENGKIKDKAKFLASLVALKVDSKIGGNNKHRKISVVASLSSVNVYTQVFSLPLLAGEALEKAVELNLQMASPNEAAKTYSSWEVVGKDESRGQLDVLGAFVDSDVVDEIIRSLFDAGFLTMAVEPRSIALTRILRDRGSGVDTKNAYLLLDIDNVGIDFLIIRNGLPYFEYTHPWKDVADESGEISLQKFEDELAASLRQVINFYGQHWTEPLSGVIVAAATLHEVIEKTVATTTTLPAVRLTLEVGQPISSEWLTAVGSSLRGTHAPKLGEGEVNLFGVVWEDRFQEERIFRFIQFWRVLVPIVFAILVAIFWGTLLLLGNAKAALEDSSSFRSNAGQAGEIAALEASTTAFNNLVTMVQGAESATSKNYEFLNAVQSLATTDGITINTLSFPGDGQMANLSGSAASDDRILAFQSALQSAKGFSAINLPVSSVQNNGGTYTFQITFQYTQS